MIKLYRYPLDWSNGLIAEILSHHGKRINLRTPPPVREMDIRTIPRDTYFTPQNTLILSEIDPSHPYDALKTRGMIKGVRLHFLTVSSPDHSGLVDAFDPSLQGGLSVVNPSWPVVIEDRMVGDPVGDLRSYSLRYGGGDSPFRPTRWALQGSLDCSEWTTLDTRDEADASSDESGRGVRQDLTAAAGAKYRCFRFVIYNGASSDQLKIDAFQIQTASSGDVFSPSLKAP